MIFINAFTQKNRKKARAALAFVSACLVFLFSPVFAQTTESWIAELSSDGSNPNPRHEAAYSRVGDKFYLLGGRGIKPVNIYDPVSRQWTNGSSPPFEIHHFQSVVFQEKIYAVCAMTGGFPGESPVSNIMIYDPATDTWSMGDMIPENRRRGSAGVVLYNDKFYIISGIQNGHLSGHVPWLDVYDPIENSWTALADAPRSRDHFHASIVDGKIFVAGGRNSIASQNVFANTIAEVDIYDIETDQWSTLTQNLPTERAGTFNAVVGSEVLVLGGESASQSVAHNETEALNVQTLNWRTLSPMIQGRHGTGVVLWDDTLFTVSGSGSQGGEPELTSQEKFTFENINQPPVITPIPDRVDEVLSTIAIEVIASDPDNDPLSYQAFGLPPGIQIQTNTGLISGTLPPESANPTPWNVTVEVSDGISTPTVETFNWQVNPLD